MTQHDPTKKDGLPRQGDAALPTADAKKAADTLGQEDARVAETGQEGSAEPAPITNTVRDPGGLSSGLQPGGTIPGKSPGASAGSIGTGGGSTGGAPTGTVKRGI